MSGMEPPERGFAHEDRCRMRDATPEWIDEGQGLWTRSCVCTFEQWRAPVRRKPEPGPDVAMHRHDPDCESKAVVKEWPEGGKYTFCPACETYTHHVKLPSDPIDREEFLAGNAYARPVGGR